MTPTLNVIKVPRPTPLKYESPRFPAFDNLHLEMMEVKRKLRAGLPLIPVKKLPPRKDVIQQRSRSNSMSSQRSHISIGVNPPEKNDDRRSSRHDRGRRDDGDREEDRRGKDDDGSVIDEGSVINDEEDDVARELGCDDESVRSSKVDDDERSDRRHRHRDGDEGSDECEGDDGDRHYHRDDLEDERDVATENHEEELDPDDPYYGLTPEQIEEKEKEEYIVRFRILKKKQRSSPNAIPIPEFNEHSDLATMKKSYERTVRELYIEDAVDRYRTYLMGSFLALEWGAVYYGIEEMKGFGVTQTKMMWKYDSMLIELGEKSQNTWGMNIPVEVRLIGMVLLQAGIFYLAKIVEKSSGEMMADMFRTMAGQKVVDSPTTGGGAASTFAGMAAAGGGRVAESPDVPIEKPPPKRKMKGPSVKLSDLPPEPTEVEDE